MIDFSCQHCSAVLRMDDAFAGRDGWCRECKRMVIVPSKGQSPRIEDLPPKEAIARLQQLLSYAAKKADLYKQLKAEAPQTAPSQADLEAATQETKDALDAEQRRARDLESRLASVRGLLKERDAQFAVLESQHDAASSTKLEEARESIASLQEKLSRAEEERANLEQVAASREVELQDLRDRQDRHEQDKEAATQRAEALAAELATNLRHRDQEMARIDADRADLVSLLDSTTAELERVNAALTEAHEARREVEFQREGLLEDLKLARGEVEFFETELKSVNERLRDSEEARDRLQRELDEILQTTLQQFESGLDGHEIPSANGHDADTAMVAVEGSLPECDAAISYSSEEQYLQGLRYEQGIEVDQDDTEAARWLALAAEQGHAEAQFHLGQMYVEGRGVPKDHATGLRWYQQAADQGQPDAACALALLCLEGADQSQDEATAVNWLRQAAEKEDSRALYLLGRMLVDEERACANPPEAVRYLERAAKGGHAEAQYKLGQLLLQGTVMPRDERRAADWFSRAAEHGHAPAQLAFGKCLEQGWGMVRQNPRAYAWYNLAALQLEEARTARDRLAGAMSKEQVLEGQRVGEHLEQRLGKVAEATVTL